MTDDHYLSFLRDLAQLLKEAAVDARLERDGARGTAREDLALGRLIAMHDVVSLLQQQADAFGIDRRTISVHDIEPSRDLV